MASSQLVNLCTNFFAYKMCRIMTTSKGDYKGKHAMYYDFYIITNYFNILYVI